MQKLQQSPGLNLGRGCFIAFAVLWTGMSCMFFLAGLGAVVLAFGASESPGPVMLSLLFPLVSLLFVAIGIGLLVFAVRPLIAAARVNKPEIALSNASPRIGEDLVLTYRQTFKRATDVASIALQLIFRESATYQRGTDSVTVTDDKVIQQFDYPGRRYEAGEPFNVRREVRIPDDAMHSFTATHNKLLWFIRAQIKMQGWPDFVEEYALTVLPEMTR